MAADFAGPPGAGFTPVNPYALARNEAIAARIRRVYKAVSVAADGEGFAVHLDGRPARTPKRLPIRLPTEAAARLVAAEFDAQGEVMNPASMPVLRLVNAVLDGVADACPEVVADVVRYASADLLLYRADSPRELVALQNASWDPVLAWARDARGIRFYLAQGVVHVTQPEHALQALRAAVDDLLGAAPGTPFRLGALHVITTLTGSAILALVVLARALSAAEAWTKAHVDEDFQIARWGRDDEAEARRARRWADMQGAAALIAAVAPDTAIEMANTK